MKDKLTEERLDNIWYEAFADRVHQLGKKWPDVLTTEEHDDAEHYADSIVRRPAGEHWNVKDEPGPGYWEAGDI